VARVPSRRALVARPFTLRDSGTSWAPFCSDCVVKALVPRQARLDRRALSRFRNSSLIRWGVLRFSRPVKRNPVDGLGKRLVAVEVDRNLDHRLDRDTEVPQDFGWGAANSELQIYLF